MSDGSVFVGSVSSGHIVELWSDDDRYSHGECSCGGWDVSTFDAHLALARWREHVDVVLPIAEQSEVLPHRGSAMKAAPNVDGRGADA